MEHRRPRSIIGPLILITIGVLLLLANLGYLPMSAWQIAAQFWPVILILVGVDIIFGRRSALGSIIVLVFWIVVIAGVVWFAMTGGAGIVPASASMLEEISQPLGDVKNATVELNGGVASVFVAPLNSDTVNLMESKFRHSTSTRIVKNYDVANSQARLSIREEGNVTAFVGVSNSRWDIALYPQIPLALHINGGVGTFTLDLAEMNVTELDIDAGVGSVNVTAPKTGAVTMRVDGGVGNVVVTIPQGVAARIQTNGGLGGVNVDQSRFAKSDKLYQSADYASATNKIDLNVNGGVGGVTIR